MSFQLVYTVGHLWRGKAHPNAYIGGGGGGGGIAPLPPPAPLPLMSETREE